MRIFCVLHDKADLLTGDVLSKEQEIDHPIIFRKVLTIRKRWSKDEFFYGSDETEIKLPFYFIDLSQHFRIYLHGLCTQVFYSWAWVRGAWCKVICIVKLKSGSNQDLFCIISTNMV